MIPIGRFKKGVQTHSVEDRVKDVHNSIVMFTFTQFLTHIDKLITRTIYPKALFLIDSSSPSLNCI